MVKGDEVCLDINTLKGMTIGDIRNKTKEMREYKTIQKELEMADKNLTKCLNDLKIK